VHYRNPALCRVPNDLTSVFRALGKEGLCQVPNKKHSVKKHSIKGFFAECFIFDTWRISLPSVFWHLAKSFFVECFIFDTRQRASLTNVFSTLGKDNLKITFWSSKLIQMKKFSATNLYNSSRWTIYILVISSYDEIKVDLFIKTISLSEFTKLQERYIRFMNNVTNNIWDE
jgi:hypothetical protein